jgi:hypothetical protein
MTPLRIRRVGYTPLGGMRAGKEWIFIAPALVLRGALVTRGFYLA